MDIETIQIVLLMILAGLVAASVLLVLVKWVWQIINAPAAIAIVIGLIAILLQFAKI